MYRPPPPRRLRILHLEDSDMDHQLVLVHLRRGNAPTVNDGEVG